MVDKDIRDAPYSYICDYYESVYKSAGRKVFSTLSLVIPSLLMPNISHSASRDIKSSINYLLIAPPGDGKSSLCETFSKLAYNSFPFESITDSKLYSVLSERDYVSLIVSDVFKIFSDKYLTKTMENVLGDEQKLSRFTQRTDSIEKKIKAVAFLAGTPNSLTSVISEGILFRTAVYLIFHDELEHEKIGEFIIDGAFEDKPKDNKELKIANYYQELFNIQLNQSKEFNRIVGYIVDKNFKREIINAWKPLVSPIVKRTKLSFFRELHQCMRYMCSHAFLSIFNREIIDNKLVIKEEDVKIAIELMKREIDTKHKILTCNSIVSEQKLRTTNELSEWVADYEKKNRMKLGEDLKSIMNSLV